MPPNSTRHLAFGPATLQGLAAGDQQALLGALVAQAELWFHAAGTSVRQRYAIGAMVCLLDGSLRNQLLLAAASDLCATLALSPQGRQALTDFVGQPVFEEAERE